MATVLEDEIENLVDKLKELGKSSRTKEKAGSQKCHNFDQQMTVLQRRLDKLGSLSEEKRAEKIKKMAEESLSMSTSFRLEVEGEHFGENVGSVS